MDAKLFDMLVFLFPGVLILFYLFLSYSLLKATPRGRQKLVVNLLIILPVYLMVNVPKIFFDIDLDSIFLIIANSALLIYSFVFYRLSKAY